jgi:CRISP-associated protein Cas1
MEHQHRNRPTTQSRTHIRNQKIDRRQPVFVSFQRGKLRREKEELVVIEITDGTQQERVKKKIPLRNISQIVLSHKNISVTTPVLHACMEKEIAIFYMGLGNQPMGQFLSLGNGGITGRMSQYKMGLKEDTCVLIAKNIVKNKIHNTYQILRRNAQTDLFTPTKRQQLKDVMKRVEVSETREHIRGLEGIAAQMYFGLFDAMIKREGMFWTFGKRTRQPPQNPINAMLGYGYGCLYRECILALQMSQLDPELGFLHVPQSGRVALALDLMEVFRSVLVDALVVMLINNRRIMEEDFEARDGGVFLTKSGKRTWLYAWEKRLQHEIQHPLLGFEMSYKRCLVEQAQLLKQYMIRYTKNEETTFPLFAIR